jgi:hypothetical protein
MSTLATGFFGLLDWEEMTGQSKFVVDIVTVPMFSAIAGLLTNWTGVIMLLAPANFTGFYLPGVKRIFPFLPRKLQILPCWAPGGIIGFQGFIPCRAEKMASIIVDKAIYRIGGIADFYNELDPDSLANNIAEKARPDIRRLTTEVIEQNHKALWDTLPRPVKEQVLKTVDAELPAVSRKAFEMIGRDIDQLLDVKLMTIQYLRSNPAVLVSIIKNMAAPELRFMVRVGALGAPFGVILALWLSFLHYSSDHVKHAHEIDPSAAYIPLPEWLSGILHFMPAWLWVLVGAALIGIIVNIIAVKVVFEPGDPQPRYKYLWKQGLFARRQHEAAAEAAQQLSIEVLTVTNFANEMLNGSGADKTRAYVQQAVSDEAKRILGPFITLARNSFGFVDVEGLEKGAGVTVVDFAPSVLYSEELNRDKAKAIEEFATEKFRELSPDDFGEMLYNAIEQDAWLLYAHGGLLGIIIGAAHILIFGT